jgi:low affinity Fe/Cu permease
MASLNDHFDRVADIVSEHVARATFFAFCFVLVVGWLAGLPIAGWKNDIYHLLLNSPTTAITFLLVALLHNTQHRAERALHRKLDLILRAVDEHITDDPELTKEIQKIVGEEAVPSKE